MKKIDELELFSFRVDERLFENETIYLLYLPESWREWIEKDKEGFQLKVKPKNLGKKLQVLFPAIFHVSWENHEPWIYASEEINTEMIKSICLHWLSNEFSHSLSELPDDIQNEVLVWKLTTMKDLYWQETWNFNWIPGLIAGKFAKQKHYLNIQDGFEGNIRFYHVYFQNNHECMSEPIRKKDKSGYFSYVIRLSLKTRGGLPEPYILNVSFGIRRFLQKKPYNTSDISNRVKGSILVHVKNPFIDNEANGMSFIQLKFKNVKGKVKWAGKEDELFADILPVSIQPQEIIANPISYMNHEPFTALVVYSDSVFRSKDNLSKVLSGIGLPEKFYLFDYFKEKFPNLTQLDKCLNIYKRKDAIGNKVLPLQHHFSPNKQIMLEFWTSEEMFEEIMKIYIENQIVIQDNKSHYYLNSEPPINLNIDCLGPQLITALENTDENQATKKRIKLINKLADKKERTNISMAFVEIEQKEYYKEKTDPKHVNRLSLAATNRISQFIHPLREDETEKERKNRLINSFFDLVADYGFLPKRMQNINEELLILGFRLIKLGTAYLPAISRIYKNDVKIRLFSYNEWLTIPEALILTSQEPKVINQPKKYNEEDKKYLSFLKRVVSECLEQFSSEIVVLLDASLRRLRWIELQNRHLDIHRLPFQLQHPDAEKRVKVVRISKEEDVSQYRINPKGVVKLNKNQGLFKDENAGIYYSVGARPTFMQTLLKTQKYNHPNQLIFQQKIIEIIPLGISDEDERDRIALLVHNLRKLNIAYDAHTNFPYPLDILKSLKKYFYKHESNDVENQEADAFEDWIRVDENDQLVFELS